MGKIFGRCSIDNISHNRKDRSLKRLVYEGVPVAFRGPVWNALSGARELKAESDRTYNEYCEDAIKLISDNDAQKVMIEDENHRGCDKGQAIKDIEKDVFRTFPDHSMFDVDGTGIQQLRRILLAYSVWNPAVGYCQGLNFMAAALYYFWAKRLFFRYYAAFVRIYCRQNTTRQSYLIFTSTYEFCRN